MRVSIRTTRRLLRTLTGAMLITAAAAAVWAWSAPPTPPTPLTPPAASTASTADPNARGVPAAAGSPPAQLRGGLPALEPIVQAAERHRFQQPLFDPPPVVVQAPPPPPLRIKLLGTIIEPPNSKAILQLASGGIEMHGIGAAIEGATLEVIEPQRVTVQYHGQSQTLEVAP